MVGSSKGAPPGWIGPAAAGLAGLVIGGVWAWRRLERYAIQAITRPVRSSYRSDPGAVGLAWEDVAFRTADGIAISAWFLPAAPDLPMARGTIILGHGYSGSRHADLAFPAFLVPAGYNVLMPDFRAHGESGGEQTSVGYIEHRDVLAAVAYLQERGLTRIGIMGFSMGAVIAIVSGALCPDLLGVLADSSYARLPVPIAQVMQQQWGYPAPVARRLGELGMRFVARNLGFDAEEAAPVRLIGRISPRPVLLIHGAADRLVPPSEAYALYAAAGPPKELWLVPGAGHDTGGFGREPEEYTRRVLAFWDRVFAPAAPAAQPGREVSHG